MGFCPEFIFFIVEMLDIFVCLFGLDIVDMYRRLEQN